jgi:hypothetical protein
MKGVGKSCEATSNYIKRLKMFKEVARSFSRSQKAELKDFLNRRQKLGIKITGCMWLDAVIAVGGAHFKEK